MSLSKDYKAYPKLNRGPGGWSCPCCRPVKDRHPKKAAHRLVRRSVKQALRQEISQ